MKEVNIYIRGICKNFGEGSELKEGKYVTLIEYKGRYKQLVGKETNTTSNRMFLIALTEGIKALKENCIINYYTPTPLGFKKPHKSPNKDLLCEILEIVEVNGHKLNENISRRYQDYLINEIRKLD